MAVGEMSLGVVSITVMSVRNSKIPKGQTKILKSEDHGQQNETKDKHRTHNTSLKTKAGVTRTLQKSG